MNSVNNFGTQIFHIMRWVMITTKKNEKKKKILINLKKNNLLITQ
jgi:hypothetical protein